MHSKTEVLRSIYLYLVSLVGVIMLVFSLIVASRSGINFIFRGSGKDLYFISEVARDTAAILAGLFLFLFHWNIIKNEGRFGSNTIHKVQSDDNFWGNLFFYIVSFVGLMVLVFSFIGIVGSLFAVNYVPVPMNSNPKIPGASKPPIPNEYLHINVKSLLQNSVSFIIGLIVWLFPWNTLQKLRAGELKKYES